MPRSAPGPTISRPSTVTVPLVGGCCGSRPATSLSTVLFPQPDGPKNDEISPWSAMSGIVKLTEEIATYSRGVPSP